MYGIPDRLKALSAAEEQVLLALWDCKPPVSRRDIGARLAEKGPLQVWPMGSILHIEPDRKSTRLNSSHRL